MKKLKMIGKRALSMFLIVLLCASMLPASAIEAEAICPCGQDECLCAGGDCGCEVDCACELCRPGTAASQVPAELENPEEPMEPEDPENPAEFEDSVEAEGWESECPADNAFDDDALEMNPEEWEPAKVEQTAWGTVSARYTTEDGINLRKDLYLDGTLLRTDIGDFCVWEGQLLYSDNRGLHRCWLPGGEEEAFGEVPRLMQMQAFQGMVLGVEESLYQLYAVDLASGQATATNYTSVDRFWFEDGHLHVRMLVDPELVEAMEETDFEVTAAQAVIAAETAEDYDDGLRNLLSASAMEEYGVSLMDAKGGPEASAFLAASVETRAIQTAVLDVSPRLYCSQLGGKLLADLGEEWNKAFSHVKVLNDKGQVVHTEDGYAYDLVFHKYKSGKCEPLRAPFDGTLTHVGQTKNHILCLTSDQMVRLPGKDKNSRIQAYLTVITMHDEDANKLVKGTNVKQGDVYSKEGMAGDATGVHVHMECRYSTDRSALTKGCVRGNIVPNEALFVKDGTNVELRTTESSGKWGKWRDVDYNPKWTQESEAVTPSPAGTITIKPGTVPKGTIPQGTRVLLTGDIKSTYDIQHIEGGFRYANSSNSPLTAIIRGNSFKEYQIKPESVLAQTLNTANLKPGTYYLWYRVTDVKGTVETWTSPDTFTVSVKAALAAPTIGITSIAGGRRVTITGPAGAAIYYEVNNGTAQSGSSPVSWDITAAGSYSIKAWTSKTGSVDSPYAKAAVTVERAAAPEISPLTVSGNRAYVTIRGTGTIYYTTNGSAPTTSSSKYSGPIYVTSNCTIKAMATESGKVNSGVSERAISCTAPAEVTSITVPNGEDRIAVGRAASVRWTAVSGAISYLARLYCDGTLEEEKSVSSPNAAFTLKKAGVYTVRVVSVNSFGSSPESTASAVVEAMAPVTVTVVDQIYRSGNMNDESVAALEQRIRDQKNDQTFKLEGNVISVQTVDYGTYAREPEVLTKEGFDFRSYSHSWDYTPITGNLTVHARFVPKTYTVEFYDYRLENSAARSRQLKRETVTYGGSATPPEVTDIPECYVLMGWSVDPGSSSCADYSFVEGPMKLYTSYGWENQDLPVTVHITGVARNERLTSYTVNLKYTNSNVSDQQARLIVSAYTSDGRMVYTQFKDLDLDKMPMGTAVTDTVTLNYAKKISRVSAVLVRTQNDLTGGALSRMSWFPELVGEEISSPASGGWSEWSDWSTKKPAEMSGREIEEKKQYRYCDIVEVPVSTEADYNYYTGKGYWIYSEGSYTTAWSSWSRTAVSAINTNTFVRKVETRYVAPTTKTQYHYFRFYKGTSAPWTTYDASAHPYFEEYWADSELPLLRNSGGMNQYGDGYKGKAGSKYWLKFTGQTSNTGKDAVTRGLVTGSNVAWTRQVQTGGGYTEYRYMETTRSYSFATWGPWGDWTDTYRNVSSIRQKREERTVYRYRDFTAAASGNDEEEPLGETYSFTFTLPEGLTSRRAVTLLVYKKTNSDPTQAQLEYVDQLEAIPSWWSADRQCSFTIKPREPLSEETGDFIITASIEGSERLTNVGVLQAPKAEYTVEFFADGNSLESQTVPAGGTADPSKISVPDKPGYYFAGWDCSTTNITEDQRINAVYERKIVTIIFVDHVNETVTPMEFAYDAPVTAPTPEAEGRTFRCWEGLDENATATGSAVYVAKWDPITYEVSFRRPDGTVVDTQNVVYGEAAEPPEPYEKDGITYPWSTTGDAWWCVRENMMVYPFIAAEYPLAMPNAVGLTAPDPETSYYGAFEVELATQEADAVIYYSIDIPIDESDALSYLAGRTEAAQAAGLLEGETSDDETEEVDDETMPEVIYPYTGAISIEAGATIYAFTANSKGEISAVARLDYQAGEEPEDDPGFHETRPIERAVFQRSTGVASVEIGWAVPTRVVAVSYTDGKRMLAVGTADTNGAEAVTIRLGTAQVETVRVFLVDPQSWKPLCSCVDANIS